MKKKDCRKQSGILFCNLIHIFRISAITVNRVSIYSYHLGHNRSDSAHLIFAGNCDSLEKLGVFPLMRVNKISCAHERFSG